MNDKSNWTWKPVTKGEFKEIFETQYNELNEEERSTFERFRVEPWKATIRRSDLAGDESVFVVARNSDTVIYYDDVEDGFNLAQVDEQGRLLDPGGGQWSLAGAVEGWRL